jgi:hypothetical protein
MHVEEATGFKLHLGNVLEELQCVVTLEKGFDGGVKLRDCVLDGCHVPLESRNYDIVLAWCVIMFEVLQCFLV